MEKETKRTEIELRSEAFQEIVEQSPRWMIRSGISLILGFLILMLAGSYFFSYPDIIETKITVMNEGSFVKTDTIINKDQKDYAVNQAHLIGKIDVSVKEARKVVPGQKVNIRLDDYPSMEFGFIKGRVLSITRLHNEDLFRIEVEMPQNLETNYSIPIKINRQLNGTAEIITDDIRLIKRFLNPVNSLLKHRQSQSN
jgi:hypothetical protein